MKLTEVIDVWDMFLDPSELAQIWSFEEFIEELGKVVELVNDIPAIGGTK